MKKNKREKLEAAGWTIGSADEFLDLTPEESAFIEMKLALAESLRRRRIRRKLTQAQLAELIESSQSRVAKMESADPSVSMDLMIRSLLTIGVSRKEVARIISATPKKAA